MIRGQPELPKQTLSRKKGGKEGRKGWRGGSAARALAVLPEDWVDCCGVDLQPSVTALPENPTRYSCGAQSFIPAKDPYTGDRNK